MVYNFDEGVFCYFILVLVYSFVIKNTIFLHLMVAPFHNQ